MTWYVAKALDALLGQLNALAPRRSKLSDGSIGDAAHSSRTSDHNPTTSGQVCARDFTHDPAGGLDCHWLARVLVASRDTRIKYVIWDRKILDTRPGFSPWQWKPYSGTNPHTKHLHLSVHSGAIGDQTGAWNLSAPKPIPEEPDMDKNQDQLLREIAVAVIDSSSPVYPGGNYVSLRDYVIAMDAKLTGLVAAVAALSNDQNLTKDEVERIIRDAMEQNIQITGNVQIGPAQGPG